MEVTPGIVFELFLEPRKPSTGLERTVSTYHYGETLETEPIQGEHYVMCADGSIQSKWFPEKPIGWELVKVPSGWAWRVSQFGFELEPCDVRIHGRAETTPRGLGKIGSQIFKAYAN